MSKLYVVQELIQGIAECPLIFTDEAKSDKHFLSLVNENYDQEFTEVEEAVNFLSENDYDIEIKYWVTDIKNKIKENVNA